MSLLPDFVLHRPLSVAEAVEMISIEDLPYVGGTELLLAMRQGLLRPRSLVSLRRIDDIRQIRMSSDQAIIGAAVTHDQAAKDPALYTHLPIIRQTLTRVGNPRVRAAGTLAGNLCFAEPKSDVIPLLIALEATVELTGPRGDRLMPVSEFVLGPFTTERHSDELVTALHLPLLSRLGTTYQKFQIMERPTVGVAGVRYRNGTSQRTRIVVGAAGIRPVVADGETIDPDDLAERIDPIADLTGSIDYKRHMTSVFVKRALRDLDTSDG